MSPTPHPPGTLQVGDRLPDVRLQPAEGERLRLHTEYAGRTMWLVVDSGADPPPLPAMASPDDIAVLVSPAPRAAVDGWRTLVADPQWCALFQPRTVYRLDTNLRVSGLTPVDAPLPSPAVSVRALQPAETVSCAPVLQIPGVFDPALCTRLVDHLLIECAGGDASRVLVLDGDDAHAQLDPRVKLRRESPIRDTALEQCVHGLLLRRVAPEIARVFQFDVTRRDPFKLLAYPQQAGYFRPHRDNDTRDVAYRRFAVSVNLNPGSYEGGDFRFPEFGPHRYAPPLGGALVFSCSLLHEVLAVEQGTRFALTTFLA